MSLVRVTAIEPCNNYRPGETFECSEREARELEAIGLVKLGLTPRNKMMPEPVNKSNPSPAAGMDAQLSASPVARVSQKTTAVPSKTGKRRGRPPGKSSR